MQEMLAGVCHGKNCACGCLLRAFRGWPRSSSSHPPPSGAVSGPLRNDLDQEGAEPQSVEDEDLNDAWLPAFVIEKELEARPASARGSHDCAQRVQNLPPTGAPSFASGAVATACW